MSKEKQIEEMAKIAEDAIDNQTPHNCPHTPCRYRNSSVCCDVCHTIESLYNAGYRKQSEGEWRLETDEEEPDPMFKWGVCSVCNNKANEPYNFCPNCGAHMRGGKK